MNYYWPLSPRIGKIQVLLGNKGWAWDLWSWLRFYRNIERAHTWPHYDFCLLSALWSFSATPEETWEGATGKAVQDKRWWWGALLQARETPQAQRSSERREGLHGRTERKGYKETGASWGLEAP